MSIAASQKGKGLQCSKVWLLLAWALVAADGAVRQCDAGLLHRHHTLLLAVYNLEPVKQPEQS